MMRPPNPIACAMTFRQPEIMAAGFEGYHSKPISVRRFLETVRAVLDGRGGTGGTS